MKKFELNEDVTIGSSIVMKKGTEVYEYEGATYGCCSGNELPCTMEPGKTPFIGIDKDKLTEITEVKSAHEVLDEIADIDKALAVNLKLMEILLRVQGCDDIDTLIEAFEEALTLLKDNRDALSK